MDEDDLEEKINEIIETNDESESNEQVEELAEVGEEEKEEEEEELKNSYEDPDALLKTLETFYMMESESILNVIEESRQLMKFSMLKLHEEQEQKKKIYMRDLQEKYALKRKEENLIPLSEYVRRKKEMLNIEMPIKKIEFEDSVPQSERDAVQTYLERKARMRREQKSAKMIANQSQNILSNMRSVGQTFENEKNKQNEFFNVQDPNRKASAIMSDFKRTESAIESEKKAQKKKIDSLLENKRGGKIVIDSVPEIDC